MTAAPEPTATPSGEASPSARPELNPVLPAIAPITAPPAPHVAQVEKPNATKPKRPKTQRVAENDRLFLEGRDDAAEALSRMTLLGPPEGISSVFPPRLLGTAGTGSASKTQGTGNIILGKMTSEGPLERKEIHTVLEGARGRLQDCYDTALSRNSTLEGEIVLFFVVSGDGTLGKVEVASNTSTGPGIEAISNCFTAVVGGFGFPSKAAESSVTFPVVFALSN